MPIFSRNSWNSFRRRTIVSLAVVGVIVVLASDPLSDLRPPNVDNICAIFDERSSWYEAAKASEARWGTPKHIQMAIMHQESSFIFNARPPRKKLLGFIPWTRQSNAYGFAQALDGTWDWYVEGTGNESARRDNFEDAINFIGWYTHKSNSSAGISRWDAYNQYLAYHEGQSGWKRKTFENKGWLKERARMVEERARKWWAELQSCEEDLERPWWLIAS